MKLFFVTLLTVAPLPFVASAQQAAPPTSNSKPTDPDKKICHRQEEVGTLFAKSVCHTRAEWAAIEAANAQNAERAMANRPRVNARPN